LAVGCAHFSTGILTRQNNAVVFLTLRKTGGAPLLTLFEKWPATAMAQ